MRGRVRAEVFFMKAKVHSPRKSPAKTYRIKRKGASPAINLVGRRFGKYLVVKFVGRNYYRNNALWRCRCECGEESVLRSHDLKPHSKCLSCAGYARRVDLTGKRFGRLVALKPQATDKTTGNVRWLCLCDCGNYSTVSTTGLRQGGTQSCGCFAREMAAIQINKNRPKVSPTMTHRGTCDPQLIPLYRVYRGLLNRCYNPNQKAYRHYGAVGVTVCKRWRGKGGFERFLADKGMRPPGTQLGRYADIGPYSPENTAWMTLQEQGIEARKKHLILKAMKKKAA